MYWEVPERNQLLDREVKAVSGGIHILIVRRIVFQKEFTHVMEKAKQFLTRPTLGIEVVCSRHCRCTG